MKKISSTQSKLRRRKVNAKKGERKASLKNHQPRIKSTLSTKKHTLGENLIMQKSKQSVIPLVMVINNLAALMTKNKTEP